MQIFLYLPLCRPLFSVSYFLLVLVLAQHILDMPLDKTIPAHIGTDQRGINVHNLTCNDLRLQAGLNRTFEDFTEPLVAPPLANARQARMIR